MTAPILGWPGIRALTTDEPDPVLDVDRFIGQRTATFRFDLTDGVSGENLGTVTPIREGATLTNDTTRTTKRDLRLALGAADTAAINPVADRISPVMLIAGREWPLGRYMFTDETDLETTGGDLADVLLLDEMWLVDQQIDRGVSTSGSVISLVQELLAGLPIPGAEIEPSPYNAVGSWPAGTNRGQILQAVATQGDYMSPWFDNRGMFRMIRTVDPDAAVPTIDLDRGARVLRNTIIKTSDILTAPNRFVVIANSGDAANTEIVGSYDVPPSAPYSVAARGFAIVETINTQVETSVQAAAMARNIGIRASVFDRRAITTPPDPRHDSYDVIRWQGLNWLELGWSMVLEEGAEMRHVLRRSFM